MLALDFSRKRQFIGVEGSMLTNLGYIAYNRQQYDAALEYYSAAMEIADKFDDSFQIANLHRNIGEVYLAQRRFGEAKHMLAVALRIAHRGQYKDMNLSVRILLHQLYHQSLDYRRAYLAMRANARIADLNYIADLEKAVEEMRIKYQIERKDQDAAFLKYQNEKLQFQIAEKEKAQAELNSTIGRLEEALSQIRVLKGFLPICSYCKKIRDENNEWHQLETYISNHSDAKFSHGLCPECIKKHYGSV